MSRENAETIARFYDAMARRDLAGAIEFCDPDVVVINTPNSPVTLRTSATTADSGGCEMRSRVSVIFESRRTRPSA